MSKVQGIQHNAWLVLRYNCLCVKPAMFAIRTNWLIIYLTVHTLLYCRAEQGRHLLWLTPDPIRQPHTGRVRQGSSNNKVMDKIHGHLCSCDSYAREAFRSLHQLLMWWAIFAALTAARSRLWQQRRGPSESRLLKKACLHRSLKHASLCAVRHSESVLHTWFVGRPGWLD